MQDLPVVLGDVRGEELLGDALERVGVERRRGFSGFPPSTSRLEPLLDLLGLGVEGLQRGAEREGLREEAAHARDDELRPAQREPVRADDDAQGVPAERGEALRELAPEDRSADRAEDPDGGLLRERRGAARHPEPRAPEHALDDAREVLVRLELHDDGDLHRDPPPRERDELADGGRDGDEDERAGDAERRRKSLRDPPPDARLAALGRVLAEEEPDAHRNGERGGRPHGAEDVRGRPRARAGRTRGRTWRPAARRSRGRGPATRPPPRPRGKGSSARASAAARRARGRPTRTPPEKIFPIERESHARRACRTITESL